MLEFSTTWVVFTIVVTLGAVVGTLLAVALLWRLRRDYRVIEAAERFEAVDLTTVVKRYVPSELQTQKAAEEMAIAKQVIGSRWPRWNRIAVVSGIIVVCSAIAASYTVHRNLQAIALARSAAKPALNLDVLKVIQGVWGWRADFEQSCENNPQTISVTSDQKKLTVHYAKPYKGPSGIHTELNFDVVSTKPDMLVLSDPASVGPDKARPTEVYIKFIEANSFSLSRSDEPLGSSGTIARCQ